MKKIQAQLQKIDLQSNFEMRCSYQYKTAFEISPSQDFQLKISPPYLKNEILNKMLVFESYIQKIIGYI